MSQDALLMKATYQRNHVIKQVRLACRHTRQPDVVRVDNVYMKVVWGKGVSVITNTQEHHNAQYDGW